MNEMRLRNRKVDITGRSIVLNSAAIVINLIAVFLIVKGFHESTEAYRSIYQFLGIGLLALTLFTMIMLKGMLLFSYVSRVLVGGLFIVSGLIKANDPWGFAFKLQEYFEPDGLSFDFPFFEAFHDYTLELSIFICVVEIVLGVAVIVGGKIKLTSWSLVIMMIFFTWLTYYTHSCVIDQQAAMAEGEMFTRQCVTDCGCFGDALKGSVGRSLTPYESFWKDLVLFYFVIIIFANQWRIKLNTVKENWVMVPGAIVVVTFFSWVFGWYFPIIFALIVILGSFVAGNLNIGKIGKDWKMAIYVAIVAFIFSLITANYLPFKDYRAYAVGNDLREQMNNGIPRIAEYDLLYENLSTGEVDTLLSGEWDEKYADGERYKYLDNVEREIQAGKDASIQDFSARIDYADMTEEMKQDEWIDSMIQADIGNYYDDLMVLSGPYGMDTISAMDYDTLYYPDSTYTVKEKFFGRISSSAPFSIDLTEHILRADFMFLMTIRDLSAVNTSSIADFKLIHEGALEKGIPFYVLCPASTAEIESFKKEYEFYPTFLSIDATEVKIIVRSNPGLVLLQEGVVLDKWPSRSIADFEDIFEDYIQTNE